MTTSHSPDIRAARLSADEYVRRFSDANPPMSQGQAVLEAAGGALLGLDGEPLRYNCRDSLFSPPFYAIAQSAHPLWQGLLQATVE